MRLACVALLALFVSFDAVAQETWTLTTADFKSEQVKIVAIDESGIKIAAGANARMVPLDEMLRIERPSAAGTPAPKLLLLLTSGDRIGGEATAMTQENLSFVATTLGEMSIPLRNVVGLIKPGTPVPPPGEIRTEDALMLANGDTVRGILGEVSPESVSITPQGAAEPTRVPLNAVAAVLLATTAQDKAAAVRSFQVRLSEPDGSILSSPTLALEDNQLKVSFHGQERSLPWRAVRSIEHLNGPVVWLSALTPVDDIQTPYTGERAQPAKMDRSILGGPIRFGSQTYPRGIGVHAYSRLSFDLDKSFKSFRTQYAIDGDLPWADVTVRIKLDDKTVLEKTSFKSGHLAAPFSVEINGANTITLEVDYGENYDVQDRFNWIEPAFLR